MDVNIGTAGWSIPRDFKNSFTAHGSHLERYARALNGVEINSSFYKEHQAKTYAKWAQATPDHFKFSLKLLKYFTHEMRLGDVSSRLSEVLATSRGLGSKWEVLLVQLPPSLSFDLEIAEAFMIALRKQFAGVIAWEPRHISWASEKALDLMADYDMTKVIADPEKCFVSRKYRRKVHPAVYVRLHGRPVIYRSEYSMEFLQMLNNRLNEVSSSGRSAWCIFDNTAYGFATKNAIDLKKMNLKE